MKRWLLLLVLSPLFGTPALGETPAKAPGLLSQHLAAGAPMLNLRLIEERAMDSSQVILPEAALSANSTLSFGLIRAGPKMPDGRLRGVSHSRSAALKFRMKF